MNSAATLVNIETRRVLLKSWQNSGSPHEHYLANETKAAGPAGQAGNRTKFFALDKTDLSIAAVVNPDPVTP